MVSIVGSSALRRLVSRRSLLVHCTALAVAASPLAVMAAGTKGQAARVLVVGDSLSAEYGIQRGSGWVSLLEQRLAKEKIAAQLVNASISGDTTSGGRSRLPALLQQHSPTHVVLELGGNDALRGLPLQMTRANLVAMVRAAKAAGAKVVLVGMQVPPNYGKAYSDEFAGMYSAVARAENIALVPFLLKGVADVPEAESLFQPDRIHPTAQAQPSLMNNVWLVLEPMLRAG
jgi:acyl-CoA thioesterase-1